MRKQIVSLCATAAPAFNSRMENLRYRHVQVGWVSVGIMGVVAILLFQVGLVGTAPRLVLQIVALTLVIAAITFSYQTIEVNDTEVVSRFALGILPKRIALADITRVEYAPSSWFEGWGIRLTTRGWLYNVSGFGAVEFTMRDGNRMRFGTDDSSNLIAAVVGIFMVTLGVWALIKTGLNTDHIFTPSKEMQFAGHPMMILLIRIRVRELEAAA